MFVTVVNARDGLEFLVAKEINYFQLVSLKGEEKKKLKNMEVEKGVAGGNERIN